MVQSYDQLLMQHGIQGVTGDSMISDLNKSLSTTSGSGALLYENLDPLMSQALINEKHFKLINDFPRTPSINPFFEYNVQTARGSNRSGGSGFAQGLAPKGSTSSFKRETIYNKFLGVLGGVTDQMLASARMGGTTVDPITQENYDRTIELLERVERELVFGNKSFLDESGNEVNFDGMLSVLTAGYAENVIDLKGAPLTFTNIDTATEKLVTDGKRASVDGYKLLQSPHVATSLNKQFTDINQVRFNKDLATGYSVTPGQRLSKYDNTFGTIEFDTSILLQEVTTNKAPLTAPANVPAAPAITTQPTPANDATGQFLAATYYYTVTAINDTGESLCTITSAVIVPDATTKVTIVITRLAGATGYRLYRGLLADGSDHQWVARVPQSVGGNITVVDYNFWGTVDATGKAANGVAVLYKPDPNDLTIAQLRPLTKMALPQVGTLFPFLLTLYCVPVFKLLNRIMIFKNCGIYTPVP